MTGIGLVKKIEKSCEIPSSNADEHPYTPTMLR